MSLSEEDKKKIQEEEQYRAKVKANLEKEKEEERYRLSVRDDLVDKNIKTSTESAGETIKQSKENVPFKKSRKKAMFRLVELAGFVLGILIVLIGIYEIKTSLFAGLTYFASGLLLFPFIWEFIYNKWHFRFPGIIRTILCFVIFIAAILISPTKSCDEACQLAKNQGTKLTATPTIATNIEVNEKSGSAWVVTEEEGNEIKQEASKYTEYAKKFCENRKTATVQYPIYEVENSKPKFITAKEGRYLTEEDCSVIMTYLVQVGLKEETIKNVVEQNRWIGMGPIELTYVVGMPDDMNKSVSQGSLGIPKQMEQWVFYRGGGHTMYVYFEDGRVTSWQDY
jgi:hypothetical protein